MPTWLSTICIGPLTGPADQNPPPLQDTTRWGVNGVDEGVSVIFNGRTYIYFGDVNPYPYDDGRLNLDLIAWTSEPHVHTHGGHLKIGWEFYLPNSSQQHGPASTQQPHWRFCVKCYSLFYCPTGTSAGRCTYDNGFHTSGGVGYEFYLPNLEQGATPSMGQPDWHYCGNCNGLCYAPNMVPTGACPAGGIHSPVGWNFVLPNNMQGATSSTGQKDWRYCAHCKGIFFDGYVHKGACPSAPGGGLRLTPLLESGTQEKGRFYAFQGEPLVGATKSDERPTGAFVWNDRVYVLANVAPKYSGRIQPGNPQFGTYLLSTSTPDQPTPLTTHYLFSPRIGKCTLPDGTVRSHNPLGLYFYVSHAPAGVSTNWRRCKWCEGLFEVVSGNSGYCFGNPAGHSPHNDSFVVYEGSIDNSDHQANWRRCAKCLMMVFNGYASKHRCPAPGGTHDLTNSPSYSMAFTSDSDVDRARPDGGWRYCAECQCMVFTGHENTIGGAMPYVVTVADHADDLPPPPSTGGIAFSGQAAVIISHRFSWLPYHYGGFALACWHLPVGAAPRLQDLLYFDPEARTWTPDVSVFTKNLFDYAYQGIPNPPGWYTETGLLWLPGPRRWMLTYTAAQPPWKFGADAGLRPVYARFAERITDLGSAADIPIFDPTTRPADKVLLVGAKSYPYGPYPLERYTSWDPRMGILDLCYLLSLYDPYQVQVMRTQIRLP